MAKQAAQAEKEVVPEEEVDRGKAALTELFNGVRNSNTPVIVERMELRIKRCSTRRTATLSSTTRPKNNTRNGVSRNDKDC